MLGSGNQLIDWEKGECYFDSDDFKNIMSICGKFTGDEDIYSDDASTYDKIKAKKVLLINAIITPEYISPMDKLFGGKASYKGYPVTEGSGSYFSSTVGVAMSAKCDDKDGAWDFMKQVISKDYVASDYLYTSLIPIREDVYKMKMESVMATKEYTDEMGNVVTPREGTDNYYGVDIKIEPLSEEDITKYRELIDNTSMTAFYNDAVIGIINEEAAAYFNKDKSLDDVCDIIQNRATTYINENK